MSKTIVRNDAYDRRIAVGASNREKDLVIWKAYSIRGGFYDTLLNFCHTVQKPSSNAFDYDEAEGTYTICITLYNTIWMRMDADMAKLRESLSVAGQIEKEYIPATHTQVRT